MGQSEVINGKDGMKLKLIPAQKSEIGNAHNNGIPKDNEGPAIMLQFSEFYMSETTVTNEHFVKFVEATGYVTEAEQVQSSLVFRGLLNIHDLEEGVDYYRTSMPWWIEVRGSNWKKPEGENSTIEDRLDHPVVHITWNDAKAYCEWVGGRLPTEVEWEVAARGGQKGLIYPWGNSLVVDGSYFANTWQGNFPLQNEALDGYIGTAPSTEFFVNEYGLHQMIGNVWEWCINPARIPLTQFITQRYSDFIENITDEKDVFYALRGGSFLCHNSYCNRFRVAARNGNTKGSSASNLGFRYVIDSQ